jgi:ATP-dependent protease Clp ATPase subunit
LAGGKIEELKRNPFHDVEPDDLLRYGLIPELVGRLPVTVSLEQLEEQALVRILLEPKNALTKQYKKLFDLEDVGVTFDPEALRSSTRSSSISRTLESPLTQRHSGPSRSGQSSEEQEREDYVPFSRRA